MIFVYFFPALGWVCTGAVGARGGVNGRLVLRPPYWYFGFFSLGFKILKNQISFSGNFNIQIITWKEHINVSSTDIIPPALSNSPQ
jgi:hypothetical protein